MLQLYLTTRLCLNYYGRRNANEDEKSKKENEKKKNNASTE
jgi:hypothetical protein